MGINTALKNTVHSSKPNGSFDNRSEFFSADNIRRDRSATIKFGNKNIIRYIEPEFGLKMNIRISGIAAAKLLNGNTPTLDQADDIRNRLFVYLAEGLEKLSKQKVNYDDLEAYIPELGKYVSHSFKGSVYELSRLYISAIGATKESKDKLFSMRSLS